ncbi:hypothetical protein PT974_07923 [Cladobotryum mycophilum]|uniref:Velvet domain-containing protein n=1 Tax=Cladobotryum mycophilum TaxID=491253 RepID=A0ABR0SC35_9HYPO
MPTQIEQMPLRNEYQLDPNIRNNSSASHIMASNMVGASIAIQPPSRARAAQILYPPIIAKQSIHDDSGAQYFATAVLLDNGGAIIDGCLEGTKAATGFQLDGSTSSSQTIVYAFSNLAITKPGSYSLRLDLYKVSAESPTAGATLVEQLEANTITVSDGDVPRQQPSSAEQDLMRRARDAGVPLP